MSMQWRGGEQEARERQRGNLSSFTPSRTSLDLAHHSTSLYTPSITQPEPPLVAPTSSSLSPLLIYPPPSHSPSASKPTLPPPAALINPSHSHVPPRRLPMR